MATANHYVFVYGTLKKGFGNHSLLLDENYEDSFFVDNGITKEKYAMFANGLIPYVNKNFAVSQIHGEIYNVDDDRLQIIDRLEGHPNWYYREKIAVIADSGKEYECWIYFNNYVGQKAVEDGNFKNPRCW